MVRMRVSKTLDVGSIPAVPANNKLLIFYIMTIAPFVMSAYFLIGLIFAFYWFDTEYSKQVKELNDSGEEDKGGVSMFLLLLCAFWPIKLVYNFIRDKVL